MQGSNRDADRTDLGTAGEGECGWIGSSTETYISTCKTDSQWEFAVWLRELNPMLWDNLDGWGGWPGREVQEERNIGIPMADSCCCLTETIHCKATVFWLKRCFKKFDSLLLIDIQVKILQILKLSTHFHIICKSHFKGKKSEFYNAKHFFFFLLTWNIKVFLNMRMGRISVFF